VVGLDGLVLGHRPAVDHHRRLVGAQPHRVEQVGVRRVLDFEVAALLADDLDGDVHARELLAAGGKRVGLPGRSSTARYAAPVPTAEPRAAGRLRF